MVRRERLVAAFCLGAAQGLPSSFFLIGLPALLREQGASLDLVAMTYLVWAPWALKWLWAPLLDADGPNAAVRALRRLDLPPLLIAGSFLALVAFPPETAGWPVFAIGALCSLSGATLQMALNRRLLLDEPEPGRRALPNGFQVAGMTAGAMTGGTLVALVAAFASWSVAVTALSALIAATALAGARMSAAPSERERLIGPSLPASLSAIVRRPRFGVLACLMLASDLATGADVLYPALLVDAGFSAAQATFLLGTVAMALILPATLAAGRGMERLAAPSVLAVLLTAKGACCLALAALGSSGGGLTAATIVASMVVSATAAVAYLQIYMRFVDSVHAASGMAILTSARTCFLIAGGLIGGRLASGVSYSALFTLAAALSLAAAILAFAYGHGRAALESPAR